MFFLNREYLKNAYGQEKIEPKQKQKEDGPVNRRDLFLESEHRMIMVKKSKRQNEAEMFTLCSNDRI